MSPESTHTTRVLKSLIQKLSKPPLSLPPTPKGDPLRVTLLIGSSLHDPLSVELFDLILPPSLPAPEHPDAASYHPLPEIKHTFRQDNKLPPRFISAVSAALVVTPWVILLSLVSSFFPLPHCLQCVYIVWLMTITVVSSCPAPNTPFFSEHFAIHSLPRRIRRSTILVLGRSQTRSSPPLRCNSFHPHCFCWENRTGKHWQSSCWQTLIIGSCKWYIHTYLCFQKKKLTSAVTKLCHRETRIPMRQ